MMQPISQDPGPADIDPLYQAALAVEQDAALKEEMAEWEAGMVADGLSDVADGPDPLK
jgi:hypothetical protein